MFGSSFCIPWRSAPVSSILIPSRSRVLFAQIVSQFSFHQRLKIFGNDHFCDNLDVVSVHSPRPSISTFSDWKSSAIYRLNSEIRYHDIDITFFWGRFLYIKKLEVNYADSEAFKIYELFISRPFFIAMIFNRWWLWKFKFKIEIFRDK